jgi:regulator of sigma E protease
LRRKPPGSVKAGRKWPAPRHVAWEQEQVMDFLSILQLPATTLVVYALPFLVALTVIVFIHELGHFLVARWCGVTVEAFSIGFGKEIAGWVDRKGTRWKICWIPLGGYVRFAGDANRRDA